MDGLHSIIFEDGSVGKQYKGTIKLMDEYIIINFDEKLIYFPRHKEIERNKKCPGCIAVSYLGILLGEIITYNNNALLSQIFEPPEELIYYCNDKRHIR
jgi:hypothetical protein